MTSTLTLTPEAFMAQPSDPEEDFEPSTTAMPTPSYLSPLESIAGSLEVMVAMLQGQAAAESADDQLRAAYDDLDRAYAKLEDELGAKQALIESVLEICKPSTSKLANAIRAALEPPIEPKSLETVGDAGPTCVKTLGDAMCDQMEHDPDAETGRPVHSGIAPGGNRVFWTADGGQAEQPATQPKAEEPEAKTGEQPTTGQPLELGPEASVEVWRDYAQLFGHTEVDHASIADIRALLGLPDPNPHNHDFRSGATPNSCACGFTLPASQ